MAKKAETVNMVDRFREFKELKNIDKTTMISVLEESFRNVLAKQFGSDDNFDVIMNPDKGDCEIYQNLIVVPDGEVENADRQIGLTGAREIDPECEIGEEVAKQIFFEKFGRRAILNLRQTLQSKILDLQKDAITSKEEFERLKPYDIIYLYLANNSREDGWKNIIKENDLIGDNIVHYNLPDDQQKAIESYLGVHSYPTYRLIDQEGNIINLNVDPRNLDTIENIIKQIYKK